MKTLVNPPNVRLAKTDAAFVERPFGSQHPGATQFVFIDGSVHNVTDGVDLDVYFGLATVSGNEVINAL